MRIGLIRTRPLLVSAALLSGFFLWSCTIPVTPVSTITGYEFVITATSAYSGLFISDSTNTPISGNSDRRITLAPVSGAQHVLSLTKSANDGTQLTITLIAYGTIQGVPNSLVVDSATTADPYVPVRLALLE